VRAVFLAEAEKDLRALRKYLIRQFDKATWLHAYAGIKATVRAAAAFPQSGTILPELEAVGLMQYRQVLAGMNRIIYEVHGDMLYIHIVCDTRRDLRSLLARRLLQGQSAT